jgi:acyl-CoA synthetase (NDP forming)
MTVDQRSLRSLFHPRGVALVGVSGRAGNPMALPLEYLLSHGYEGGVYPVNPNYAELRGRTCYASLQDVPGPVDLVLILVPAAQAEAAIAECGAAGATAAVVFASGFAETGPSGAALQQRLVAAGEAAGVRVLGPNCQGLIYSPTGLVATFTAGAARAAGTDSGIAYIGQSGAIGGSVLDLASEMGVGLTAWVSTGNQADLDLVDVATVLIDDPAVRVLMLYVEAVDDGAAYARFAAQAEQAGKRVVLLRSGLSTAGRRAALSHTGSMLGNDIAFSLTSDRHRVVLVDDVDELLAVSAMLALGPGAQGSRVGVVTTSGGAGGLAADRCEDEGLELPVLADHTQARLRPLIPDFGAATNPVDVTAQLFSRGPDAFGEVCRIVADDDSIDSVCVVITMVVGPLGLQLAEDLVATAATLGKPMTVTWLAGHDLTRGGRAVFRAAGIPVFSSARGAARATARLVGAAGMPASPAAVSVGSGLARDRLHRALADEPFDGAELLAAIGIDQPFSRLVTSAAEAEQAARQVDAPFAMKLQAAGLAHKSDVGGVRLGVMAVDARLVFDELSSTAARHGIPEVEGVLVQEMVEPGLELILGATGGGQGFPPVITVGLGGVNTELYRDLSSALAPVTAPEARAMLRRLKAWPLLDGYRGADRADVDAAVEAIVRLSRAAFLLGPRMQELEINPLIVGAAGRGAIAVDVLVHQGNQDCVDGVVCDESDSAVLRSEK